MPNDPYQGGNQADGTALVFNALITGAVLDSGTYWYQWTEQSFDPTTGQFVVLQNGRTGTYDPTGPTGNSPTLEINNESVKVGTYVKLKLRGVLAGDLFFDFEAPAGTLNDCSGFGWTSVLTLGDCLEVSVDGVDTDIALTTTDGFTWTGTITICTLSFLVTFTSGAGTCNGPCLTLTPVSGSAIVLTGTPDCGGCDYAAFGFSTVGLCGGSRVMGDLCANMTSVRVDYIACPQITTSCCPDNPIPEQLCLTFTSSDPAYSGYNGRSFILTFNGAASSLPDIALWCSTLQTGTPNAPELFTFSCDTHISPQFHVSSATSSAGINPICGVGIGTAVIQTASESSDCSPFEVIATCYIGSSTHDLTATVTPYTGPPCGACTPIAGWMGPGYYCVGNPTCDTPEAVELFASDECNTNIMICSGPYPTLAIAEAACGGSSVPGCCSGQAIPSTGTVLFNLTLFTGTCTTSNCPDDGSLTEGSPGAWATTDGLYGGKNFHLACTAGVWTAWLDTTPHTNGTFVAVLCPSQTGNGTCQVTFNFTFTGTPCIGNAQVVFDLGFM